MLNQRKKEAIKREIKEAGIKVSDREFNKMMTRIHPERILSRRPPSFVEKLKLFKEMEALSGKRAVLDLKDSDFTSLDKNLLVAGTTQRQLVENDFIDLVNSDIVTTSDVNLLKWNVEGACRGVQERFEQLTAVENMQGFGLVSWGNTCNLNVAIQSMIRMIPDEVLDRLSQTKNPNPDLELFRVSFCKLAREAKDILAGRKS